MSSPSVPTTGVVHINQAEWLAEDMCYNSINLIWEEALAEYEADPQAWLDANGFDDETPETFEFGDNWVDTGNETYLVGGWIKVDGQYEPDLESEYSAIVGEIYAQIVHSQYVDSCALCSPCYPGQGNIGSNGEFLAYTLPVSMWGEFLEEEGKRRIRYLTALYQAQRVIGVVQRFLDGKEPVRYVKSVLKQASDTLANLEE